jgi:hypothetical protein
MNVLLFLYVFVLFFVLTPGILVTLPPKGSKMVVAAVHAVAFSLILCVTYKMVWKFTGKTLEGLTPSLAPSPAPSPASAYKMTMP